MDLNTPSPGRISDAIRPPASSGARGGPNAGAVHYSKFISPGSRPVPKPATHEAVIPMGPVLVLSAKARLSVARPLKTFRGRDIVPVRYYDWIAPFWPPHAVESGAESISSSGPSTHLFTRNSTSALAPRHPSARPLGISRRRPRFVLAREHDRYAGSCISPRPSSRRCSSGR